MKLSMKNFFSKCDQIRSFLRMWSCLLKKSLMENFIFCAVFVAYIGQALVTVVMRTVVMLLFFHKHESLNRGV